MSPGIGQRRFAVALQKIRLERLGVFHREQHGGEHHFAIERDRLAAELALGRVGHLLQFDLRERLAWTIFTWPPQSKITRSLSVRRTQFVLLLDLLRLARVAHIVHGLDGNVSDSPSGIRSAAR